MTHLPTVALLLAAVSSLAGCVKDDLDKSEALAALTRMDKTALRLRHSQALLTGARETLERIPAEEKVKLSDALALVIEAEARLEKFNKERLNP